MEIGKVGQYIKWLLWDWWHGESVSAYDVKRARQPKSPRVEIGSFTFPIWILYLLGAIVLGVIIGLLVMSVSHITFVSGSDLSHPGLTQVGQCVASDATGRIYYALDCMVEQHSTAIGNILILLLIFGSGFASGSLYQSQRQKHSS